MNARQIATLTLLVVCIAILQSHSMDFWTKEVSANTGWIMSLALEGSALWLWSYRGKKRWLGGIVTMLLLSGPVYMTSAPLVKEWTDTDSASTVNSERRTQVETEIASLEKSLAKYQAREQSQNNDWMVYSTERQLKKARAERAKLTENVVVKPHTSWQSAMIIIMQVLAMVVLQVVGVLCINELKTVLNPAKKAKTRRKSKKTSKKKPVVTMDSVNDGMVTIPTKVA